MKRLIEGIELHGKTKDAGYKYPFYLIRTPDGKYIQLSELLYQTVAAIKQESTETGVASRVSKLQNKDVDSVAIQFLITTKLEPLGIIAGSEAQFQLTKQQSTPEPADINMLKYRMTVLPKKAVRFIADIYLPFFDKRVVWVVLVGVVLLNVWLFGFHGINAGLQETLYEPIIFLLIIGLIMLSSLFHEIGHAAGAMYGGSKPGRIGAGMYLIWPAFFTDITDVYRLGRKARLRSDLGGVYFNLIFSVIVGIVYMLTQFEPLLLLVVIQNLAVFHQLLPFLRLDGYFIVSDLVGVPDLFMRIGPILQNVFLRKKTNATKDLKPWVKWVVTIWVVITMPILALIIFSMTLSAPGIFGSAASSAQIHINALQSSLGEKDYFVAAIRGLQILILMLPALGIGMMLYLLGKPLVSRINAKLDSYISPSASI